MGGGSSTPKVTTGYKGHLNGLKDGQVWAGRIDQEVQNQWASQEYELTQKAVRADRESEIAAWHAKMHEKDARMFAEIAQKAEAQAEAAARMEVLKKQPKLEEYNSFCGELKMWLNEPEHRARRRDPELLKQLGFCGSIDSYLTMSTRQSIKDTVHALGYKLVGEDRGVARDVAADAVRAGYRPDFYQLHPAQVYTPQYAQGLTNPSVAYGVQGIRKLESGMEKAVDVSRGVEDRASKLNLQVMRSGHQDLETLNMQRAEQAMVPILPAPPAVQRRRAQQPLYRRVGSERKGLASFL